MYQRDYLVRLIQEMTTLIGRALGLQQKEKKDLLQEWDELLDRRFRLTGPLADSLSVDDLIRLFDRHGRIQADELQAFAYILLERADLLRDVELKELGREASEVSYIRRVMKGYELLLEAMLHDSDRRMLKVMEKAEHAAKLLRPYSLPSSLLERVWRWHDRDGRYAEAENACYDGINNEQDPISRSAVLAWYQKLLKLTDDELEQGGLSREEVEEAIADIGELPQASTSDPS
ncbi:DUF6483 family protein [Paenibacillus marinisediminis]